MSDILIKNMEMPKKCSSCSMNYLRYGSLSTGYFEHECKFMPNQIFSSTVEEYNKRHPNCPLVALPEYGRLIDADQTIKRLDDAYCKDCDNWNGIKCKTYDVFDTQRELEDAPTIVEASK